MNDSFLLTQHSGFEEMENSAETLEELVRIEMEFAWKKWARARSLGLPATLPARVEEYIARFPVLNVPATVLRLVQHEHEVRCRFGDGPSHEEYRTRYPGFHIGEDKQERMVSGEGETGTLPPTIPTPELPGTLGRVAGPALQARRPWKKIGEHEILEEIGRGSWGIVYRARHLRLGHVVALKVLAQASVDPAEARAFEAEAGALAHARHEHIVWIYECKVDHTPPYIAMEYVAGGTLRDKVKDRVMSPRPAAEMVRRLAEAVQAAHAQRIVHRDLKPQNVLMTPEGKPKIVDFGLAKRLDLALGERDGKGGIAGTPPYMAPEQVRGEPADERTDIYALGAILYELLTGRAPFLGNSVQAIFKSVEHEEPVPPRLLTQERLPTDLEAICLKCLQKSPRDRYPSARALAGDLQCFLDGKPTAARPASPWERMGKWVKRNPWPTAFVCICCVVLVTMISLIHIALLRQQEEKYTGELQAQMQLVEQQFEGHRGLLKELMNEAQRRSLRSLEHFREPIRRYYTQTIDQLEGRPQLREQLAQAYESNAELEKIFGQPAAAADAYRKALRTYQDLFNATREPKYKEDWARSLTERGILLQGMADKHPSLAGEAKEHYQQAIALLEELRTTSGDEQSYRWHLAEAHHNLALWYNSSSGEKEPDRQQSIKEHHQALELRRALVEQTGFRKCRRDLARTYGYLGDVYLDQGDQENAKANYDRAMTIREALHREDPEDEDAAFQLARTYTNSARLFALQGNLSGAIADYARAVSLEKDLVEAREGVLDYQRDLIWMSSNLADLMMDGPEPRDWEAALDHLNEAEAAARAIYELNRSDKGNRQSLAGVQLLLGKYHACRPQPDWEKARQALLQATDGLLGGEAEDRKPLSPESQYRRAQLHVLYARLLDPNNPPLALALDNAWLGMNPSRHKEEALTHLKNALEAGDEPLRRSFAHDIAFNTLAGEERFRALKQKYAQGPR